ncbi:DNA gyrase inhibitor YacG [Deefgea salmonis]|uniref:DNA gyrase inhibitor YacG n=1 Tax=Deefgea salmonis TaxID=2875502 RepID=A0ABS8BNT7_9NEIS|nr:DNA gyrase inhibitor YacG [Deefgea salmonis]MCB5197234.1 DNA gyrase inhibitor YacG [Deefgea salmonis]
MKKIIKCPSCGHSTPYSPDNAFRPFCSERCKLIDLGAWASESYRVPDESNPPELLELDPFKLDD